MEDMLCTCTQADLQGMKHNSGSNHKFPTHGNAGVATRGEPLANRAVSRPCA